MRTRPSSRVIVIDEQNRVLLFRFVFKEGALAGTVFWATPGGALNDKETYEAGAVRELFEETGIQADTLDGPVAERRFEMVLPSGECVLGDERLFLLRVSRPQLTNQHQMDDERQFLAEHKWWSAAELRTACDTIYPVDLADIIKSVTRRR